MKKKALLRGLLGFPLGVFIGYTITILISLSMKQGSYFPVVPAFVEASGNEMNAVLVQYLLSGLLGAVSAAGSVIWEMDTWSISRMTVTHFLVLSLSMFPIAYITHWMEHSPAGILFYFGVFMGLYVVIWCSLFFSFKSKINKINRRIRENG